MTGFTLYEMLGKLVIAILLGGLIGLERETHGRPAGLRTHILVCFGAALFTMCSYTISASYISAGKYFDPSRITAQIVTGIGFLGAGTIIHHGSIVRGLTTAASIWTVAAIGIAAAVGGDLLILAVIASVLVFATLSVVAHIERTMLAKSNDLHLTLTLQLAPESLSKALAIVARHGLGVNLASCESLTDEDTQVARLKIRVGPNFDEAPLNSELASCPDVLSYSWE